MKTKINNYQVPNSLTHSLGVITATFDNSVFTVNLSALTANALYYLYVRDVAGTPTMFFVTTIPSTYRVSFSDAITVGAFYADGLTVVGFGSFINITGVPQSNEISYIPASFQGFGTAVNINIRGKRIGDIFETGGRFTAGTVTAAEGRVSLFTGLTSSSAIAALEVAGTHSNNSNSTNDHGGNTLREPSVQHITFSTRGIWGSNTTTPLNKGQGAEAVATGAILSFNAKVPIQGWSNIPLKDA